MSPRTRCGAKCTTTGYKSGTRKHIEARGHRIVAHFGGQWSDLNGGHSGRAFTMPNPMYHLP
ncbi:HAD family acid phosphatase [Streptomyces sp. I05A-00742]|uniref:HAD family acid phosphatase n=1 Tax=Streptomyces sp. I05A-00742 TaxID=2732853 RepID=UPI0037D9B0BE